MISKRWWGAVLPVVVCMACGRTPLERVDVRSEDGRSEAVVGFYNLENLFDTIDDASNPGDDEFLPTSDKQYTPERYNEHLAHLAQAIHDLGGKESPGGPAVLGVCEVENEQVLLDLVQQPVLLAAGYQVLHRESPDYRGIDNAVIYRSDQFEPFYVATKGVSLPRFPDGRVRTTRDIFIAVGRLKGDTLAVVVNHWPSRGGGDLAETAKLRRVAATATRQVVDSLLAMDTDADVLVMGDFNDTPQDASVQEVLNTVAIRAEATADRLYNPFAAIAARGEGTLQYRGEWFLFDQIIGSQGIAVPSADWSLLQTRILREPYLFQQTGDYAGSPARNYAGDRYLGGYSDHLPVAVVLVRPIR